jgi:hypothetical protein
MIAALYALHSLYLALYPELKLVLKRRRSDELITIQEPHAILPTLVESLSSIRVNSIQENIHSQNYLLTSLAVKPEVSSLKISKPKLDTALSQVKSHLETHFNITQSLSH